MSDECEAVYRNGRFHFKCRGDAEPGSLYCNKHWEYAVFDAEEVSDGPQK